MNFSRTSQPAKRKLEEASNTNLSQGRRRMFSALSLKKCDKGPNADNKNGSFSFETSAVKRPCSNKEPNRTEKNYKFEHNLLEDTLFDDINFTQILMNNDERKPKPSTSNTVPTNNKAYDKLKEEQSETTPTDPFLSYLNDSTPKPGLSQLSQLFENSQIINQIDSILSDKENSSASCKLKQTKSENLGDVLNETNREQLESYFDQIEHSVSLLGTDAEVETEIFDLLSSLQAANTSVSDETNATLSGINSSFASALKQVLANNVSKEIVAAPKISGTCVAKEGAKFTEVGPFYGLPLRVKQLIALYKGIEQLYDWQDECLKLPAIKERKNLIYALPTSGGKTLVAEILMLREIMCYKRNALFILPYVAIVQEKVWALSPFAVALNFLVEEYAASKGTYPPRKRRRKNSLYVATTEKALGLLNSLIETGRTSEIGLVVVDELHLVGEQGRGATLEALLTKLTFTKADIHIVGMSATIGNVHEISKFLNAEIYMQNFRPVELVEYVKCGVEIAKINCSKREEKLLTVVRSMNREGKENSDTIDPDKLGNLVMEVIPDGSCLIFCPSKKNCENVAYLLCKVVDRNLINFKKEEKEQVKHALKDEGGSLCKIFNVSIQLGIAYHHSGLTNEERRVIEDAFRAGIISVICCTSTLAAGVNLPAKRVILRQPYVGRDFITLSKYKQMVGRAGRAGLGETGESILICSNSDLPKVRKLLMSPMDEALSSMHENEGRGLRHLVLSCISLGIANTRSQLQEVTKKTLLNIQGEHLGVNVKKLTDKVIGDLFKLGALQEANLNKEENDVNCDVTLRMDTSLSNTSLDGSFKKKRKIVLKNDTKLVISRLGCAAIKGNFELSRAHQLYDDLHQAQKSLVLIDCLHLLYLVTPYELAEQIRPNKIDYYNIYCQLGPSELHTAGILGIKDSVALKLLANQPIKTVPEKVLNRFFLTLMLNDLWNEKPIFEVSEKFQINRGIVQSLMTGASTFAASVVHFCEELEEFWTFAHLLKGMSQRLAHCCVKELVPLMELPAVKQSRARQLYNAGYKTIHSIAGANPDHLVDEIEYMSKRVAKQLIAAAKMLLLAKVENLREDAENVMEGIENPKPVFN